MATENEITDQSSREEEREYAKRRAQVIVLVAVLVLLLLLLCGVGYIVLDILRPRGGDADKTSSGNKDLVWVRSIYGWGDAADERLATPSDVSVGADGTIWTNVARRGLVVGFSPDGQLRNVIGPDSSGTSVLKNPNGIAAADNGEIYVTDQYLDHVFVFSPDGEVVRSWRVKTPRDVEVAGDRVFVSAMGGTGIFDTKGQLLTSVGTFGGKKDQFRGPLAVTVNDETGDFYICDTLNMRVKAYDKEANLKWIYPSFAQNVPLKEGNLTGFMTTDASGSAPFNLPVGAVVDGNGRLIVLDSFLFDMSVMDPAKNGEILGRYGTQGSTDGKMFYPTDFAYDADRDWIVVADTNNNRLQIFRLKGTAPASIKGTFARMSSAAKWACGLPLLLLLILLGLVALRRRASTKTRQHERGLETAIEDGDATP